MLQGHKHIQCMIVDNIDNQDEALARRMKHHVQNLRGLFLRGSWFFMLLLKDLEKDTCLIVAQTCAKNGSRMSGRYV